MTRRLVWVLVVALATACGGVAAGTLQLKVQDQVKVRVSPDGAVIMNKVRVATVDEKGKVVRSDGKLWAWVNPESIRLPGGAQIPIKTDPDGNLYLPQAAQEQAGVKTVRTRVAAGGRVITKDGGETNFVIEGADDVESRRMGLLMLLMFANPPQDTEQE